MFHLNKKTALESAVFFTDVSYRAIQIPAPCVVMSLVLASTFCKVSKNDKRVVSNACHTAGIRERSIIIARPRPSTRKIFMCVNFYEKVYVDSTKSARWSYYHPAPSLVDITSRFKSQVPSTGEDLFAFFNELSVLQIIISYVIY